MPLRWFRQVQSNNHRSDHRYGAENRHFIELRNVVKSYESAAGAFVALKEINLQIDPGEFVAVIGKSGSGKTTLLNMLTGIDRPTSGEVYVGATAVHKLSEGKMAVWRGNYVGIVFQFFQLLPTLTIIENVMLPMDFRHRYPLRERGERAMYLLEQMELAEQAYKLPAALSGGQQQRVAIARALANDPPLIVADEPTGNLDSKTAESIFHLFEELVAEGKTILMVTHDKDLARQITRTIFLADGEIVGDRSRKASRKDQARGESGPKDGKLEPDGLEEIRERVALILDDLPSAEDRLQEELQRMAQDRRMTEAFYRAAMEEFDQRTTLAEQEGRHEEAREVWRILVNATQSWAAHPADGKPKEFSPDHSHSIKLDSKTE